MTLGREDENWHKAISSHTCLQNVMMFGVGLELYADVKSTLPENVNPECREQVMKIEAEVNHSIAEKESGGPSSSKGAKRALDKVYMRSTVVSIRRIPQPDP